MISKMTSGAGSIFAKIFVVFFMLLALSSLVLMDVRGVVSGGPGAANVASVNGEKISIRSFERNLFQLGRNFNLPRESLANDQIMQLALQGLVTDAVIGQGVQSDTKLRFDDRAIAARISDVLFDPLSELSLTERYQQMLRNNGMREEEFEAQMEIDLARDLFEQTLQAVSYPSNVIQSLNEAVANQKRDIIVFTLQEPSPETIVIDEAAEGFMQNYYNDNLDFFVTPERRSATRYTLSASALEDLDIDASQNLIFEIEDSFAGGDEPQTIVDQYDLESEAIADELSQLEARTAEEALLFELDLDLISDGIAQDNGDVAFYHVTNIVDSNPLSYEDARPQLENIWRGSQLSQVVRQLEIGLRTTDDPRAFAQDNDNIRTRSVNNVEMDSEEFAPVFEVSELNTIIPISEDDKGQKRLATITSINNIEKISDITPPDTAETNSAVANTDFELFAQYWFDNADVDINDNALNLVAQALQGDDAR